METQWLEHHWEGVDRDKNESPATSGSWEDVVHWVKEMEQEQPVKEEEEHQVSEVSWEWEEEEVVHSIKDRQAHDHGV